jgi:acetyl esterase/lipase
VFASVDVTSDIAYGQSLDEFGVLQTLYLDLYEPSGDAEPSRPVVIFVHGGGFTGGSKSAWAPVDYSTQMAKRGFVAASIDYRLRQEPGAGTAAAIDAKHDAQAAVRWFRANSATYNINAAQISMAGFSAGAITSLIVAYTSDDPGDSGNPGYPSDISVVIDVSGSLYGLADALMEPGEPPLMIVHGTADTTVPYSGATELVAAAEADGIPYELHAYEGEGHGIFGPHLDEIAEWSGLFIFNHVLQIDTDADGCWDSKEAGPDETLGGLRDHLNPWDYFNPTNDGQNRVDDILAVVDHYFVSAGEPGYEDGRYDRSAIPETPTQPWRLGPPDGQVLVDDILHVLNSYFHDCAPY